MFFEKGADPLVGVVSCPCVSRTSPVRELAYGKQCARTRIFAGPAFLAHCPPSRSVHCATRGFLRAALDRLCFDNCDVCVIMDDTGWVCALLPKLGAESSGFRSPRAQGRLFGSRPIAGSLTSSGTGRPTDFRLHLGVLAMSSMTAGITAAMTWCRRWLGAHMAGRSSRVVEVPASRAQLGAYGHHSRSGDSWC